MFNMFRRKKEEAPLELYLFIKGDAAPGYADSDEDTASIDAVFDRLTTSPTRDGKMEVKLTENGNAFVRIFTDSSIEEAEVKKYFPLNDVTALPAVKGAYVIGDITDDEKSEFIKFIDSNGVYKVKDIIEEDSRFFVKEG